VKTPEALRKPGRPRAIPEKMDPVVAQLYHQGCGYRAISRLLRNEHGISSHYTTVKRVLKRLGVLNKPDMNR
jgi:transposase-like protein